MNSKSFIHKGFTIFIIFLSLFIIFSTSGMSKDIIVDNTSRWYKSVGDWTTSSFASTQFGVNYQYAVTTSVLSEATCYAIWQPHFTNSTTYQVYMFYPEGWNRPQDAQIFIQHDGGLSEIYSNQTVHGGQWNLLGTFSFSSGKSGYVKITNYSKTDGLVVMADAVKFSSYSLPKMKQGGEFRAFWADSWGEGMLNETQALAMVDTARRYNYNAIFSEVRKLGDAYFKSSYEPWASNITPPQFDILSTILKSAHDTSNGKPYIEVHAWMVTYRDYTYGASSIITDTTHHVYFQHPEWFTQTCYGIQTVSGGNMFLDPGVPDVEDYLVKIYTDIIRHYDVDGIHYDYVRLDGPDWGYNSISSTRFSQEYGFSPATSKNSPGWETWSQWRRDQITALLKKVYVNAMEINPKVKVTGSFVTWHPYDPDFTKTRPYAEAFQDWQTFMKEHLVDASVPMNYFRDTSEIYQKDFRGWADFAVKKSYGRHAYIGTGLYLNTMENNKIQNIYIRETAKAQGIVGYSYKGTNNQNISNTEFYSMMSSELYPTPIHTPGMIWKSRPKTGFLKGQVYSPELGPVPFYNGKVVYKARVVATNTSNNTSYTTTTDGTGFYAFMELPPGTYNVTVNSPIIYRNKKTQAGKKVQAGLVSTADFNL